MKVTRAYWLGLGSGLILSAMLTLVISPQQGQVVVPQTPTSVPPLKQQAITQPLAVETKQADPLPASIPPVSTQQNIIIPKGASSERIADLLVAQGLISVFEPVLQGSIYFDSVTRRVRYSRWSGADVPIEFASALAGEVTGIVIPLLTAPHHSMVIIEEPETQLHYSSQILMAFALAALAKMLGHRIALSTHSDVLAVSLAYLSTLKIDKESLTRLVEDILKLQGIEGAGEKTKKLVEAVASEERLDIRFYYFEPKPDGSTNVVEKKPIEILREVPGATQAIDKLAEWALSSEWYEQ